LREKNISASFGIACYPLHGSSPQELIQVADASMYLSKHQGGNAVSTADHFDPNEAKKWKRDVLEAYLGVTLKRLFSTGPEAFEEIYQRLKQFTESLASTEIVSPTSVLTEKPDGPQALPQAVLDTVTSLAFAIDAKDHYTQGHSQKVSAYAALIAEALNMNDAEVEEIRLGAVLHDIGKVGIPEQILNKSGPLNPEEWDLMKSHVVFGAKILEPLTPLARIRQMVLHHHEFFDGSGYPDALTGEDIPLGARIVAVADAYDTITSDRTYKKGRRHPMPWPNWNAARMRSSTQNRPDFRAGDAAASKSNHRSRLAFYRPQLVISSTQSRSVAISAWETVPCKRRK